MLLKRTLGSLIGPVSLASWLPWVEQLAGVYALHPKARPVKALGPSEQRQNKQMKPEIVSRAQISHSSSKTNHFRYLASAIEN